MKEQILQPVEEVWRHHCAALNDALAETITALKNVLRLDEYHRHGHDADHLERALGPFAETSLDLGSLSRVLGDSALSRSMAPERLKRVQELIQTLGEMKEACSITPTDFATVEIETEENEILELAEEHLNRIARVFRTLRMAQLEVRSKYESATHDAVFADFNWRQLGPGELRLCPPFVVMARLYDDSGAQLRKMMSLLESGMPIKIAAHRSSLREVYAPASDTSVPSTMSIETLPLAMRGVYFLQTCVAAPDFQKQIFEGLTAPRPGVISVLCQRDGEKQAAFHSRAERAVLSRAFPMCVYDPDRANRFGMCFDLSSNPAPDTLWTTETLSARRGRKALHLCPLRSLRGGVRCGVYRPASNGRSPDPDHRVPRLLATAAGRETSLHFGRRQRWQHRSQSCFAGDYLAVLGPPPSLAHPSGNLRDRQSACEHQPRRAEEQPAGGNGEGRCSPRAGRRHLRCA